MKRFYNNPNKANAKFGKLAYRTHRLNLSGGFMRGGIRL